ncbi:MAG: hypothetical protein KAY50_04760 [Chitinophagaceae bacterium]|nr:hypothetical protein [Chitinophagaceae bacterium]
MRKILAISLICLFALSQYAKQLSYVECKLSNTFKAETAKCDCETILSQDNTSTPDQPANTTHFHVHIDDVYFVEKNAANSLFQFASANLNSRYLNKECNGYSQLPLQPPRS